LFSSFVSRDTAFECIQKVWKIDNARQALATPSASLHGRHDSSVSDSPNASATPSAAAACTPSGASMSATPLTSMSMPAIYHHQSTSALPSMQLPNSPASRSRSGSGGANTKAPQRQAMAASKLKLTSSLRARVADTLSPSVPLMTERSASDKAIGMCKSHR
jgi:hypothetical protein